MCDSWLLAKHENYYYKVRLAGEGGVGETHLTTMPSVYLGQVTEVLGHRLRDT